MCLTSKVRQDSALSRCLIFEVRPQKGKSGTEYPTKWGCSSAGRAPALQAGGHRFDPVHLHQPKGNDNMFIRAHSSGG